MFSLGVFALKVIPCMVLFGFQQNVITSYLHKIITQPPLKDEMDEYGNEEKETVLTSLLMPEVGRLNNDLFQK